jgi:PAS domain S-box-containing protein
LLQKLLHTAPWLDNVFHRVSDAIIITNEYHIIQYMNGEAERIIGGSFNPDTTLDLFAEFNLLNEIYQPVLPIYFDKIKIEPYEYTGVSLLVNKIHREFLVQCSVSAIKDDTKVKGYVLIVKDIGQERARETEKKSNERRYNFLFENVLEGILILDEDANIIDANPAACTIFSMERKNFMKLQIKNIFPHKTAEEADLIWLDFLHTGYLEGLYKFRRGNGKEIYIDFKAKANFLPQVHLAVFKDVSALKEAERANELYQSYLDVKMHDSDPIVLLDRNDRILYINNPASARLSSIWGATFEKGDSLFDKIPESMKPAFSKKWNSVIAGSHAFLQLDYNSYSINWKINPLRDTEERIIGASIEFSDNLVPVRATYHTHSMMELSEKRFRTLAENSPDIIYIIDLRRREVIYFNRDMIFGYSSAELKVTEGWIQIVHPDDAKRVKAHWNKFIKTAVGTESIEYRLRKRNEDYEWVINRHTIIERDDEGQALFVLLNITIITERKHTEDALRDSQTRLSALIENTNDIVWSVNKDFNFTAMNSSFRNLIKNNFKKSVKEGDNLLEALPSRINVEWIQYHRRALLGESFSTEFNVTSKNKNFSFEVSFNPIINAGGEVMGVSVFGRDITLRKSAEHDIIRTNFELDSFVYRASHDLRAPLRSVLGLINIVKTEEHAEQRSLYLNLVDKSINKLDTFIADLTNFSRNSRLDIKIEKINFKSIIEECIENLRYMENASLIDIRSEIFEKYDFYSDAGRISIILQNLLSNAIKYRNPAADKSYALIKVHIEKAQCHFVLEDNGKGIRNEYLDKIFNMFFRASHDSYGSGLGLYITKQVVEKLNGSVSVSSTLGKGSVFEIKLPNLFRNI